MEEDEFGSPEIYEAPEGFGEPERLKEQDLLNPAYLGKIRDYMVTRNGVDYVEAEPEKVLGDFLSTQRYIDSGNSYTLTREAIFLNGLKDEERSKVAEVYGMFENLGSNVFSGDSNSLEGVRDYAGAILLDPVNIIGLGIGKLATGASARLASGAVREAARLSRAKVVQEAIEAGAGTAVAAQAGKYTFRRVVEQGLRRQRLAQYGITGAAEGAIIAGQDAGRQRVRQMADPDREFNFTELGLAGALGVAGGVASVALQKLGPNLGNAQVRQMLNKPLTAEQNKEVKRATLQNILRSLEETDWLAAAAKGRSLLGADGTLDGSLFKELLLGNKEKGVRGIVDFMQAANVRIETRVGRTIVDFLKDVPADMKTEFNKAFAEASKGTFGSVDDFANKFAATVRRAGQDNQVLSQARLAMERRILSNSAMEEALINATGVAENKKLDDIVEGSYLSYFQNVWKRLLVSNINTTMINVAGSSLYVAGTTARDMLMATTAVLTGRSNRAGQLLSVTTDRMKFFLDDLSFNERSQNRVLFEEILKIDPSSFEQLRRTVNMGMAQPEDFDKLLKSYKFENLSPAAKKFLGVTEAVVTGAQKLTLVQTQDMFFKAFGLRDNLNRIARLKHGRSLDEIIAAGDFKRLFDSDDFGEATHRTLQMTFSADYTSRNKAYNNTNASLEQMARIVEGISNTPGAGFVFPFGKFMNNVVATSYQYFPIVPSIVELTHYSASKMLGRKGVKFNEDAFTNGLVGLGAAAYAYDMAKERRVNGTNDPWNIVRHPTGDRVDIRNVYPYSAMAVYGELFYRLGNDEPIDANLVRDIGEQIALGQAAEDLNFIDVMETLVVFGTSTPGEFLANRSGNTGSIPEGAGTLIGSILSGMTRPLATLDDFTGLVTGNLDVLDRKITDEQDGVSRGLHAMKAEALRYTQRIFDAFTAESEDTVDPELKLRFDAVKSGTSSVVNPFSKALFFGDTQGSRTNSEKMLEMAQMAPWMANFRSQHPHFNRVANEYISPLLELYAREEIRTGALERKMPSERRVRVQAILRGVQNEVRDRIENGLKPSHMEWGVERQLLGMIENRNSVDAFNTAVRQLGLTTTDPRQMSLQEKVDLLEKIDQIQEMNAY